MENSNLTNSQIKKELTTITRLYFLQAVSKYNLLTDMPMPKVACDIKGNRTAGYAVINKNLIRYNLEIAKNNWEVFKNRTPAHEVAHIICSIVYPRASAHGREWQSIMRNLGFSPSRCHHYDVSGIPPARKTQKFSYSCACGCGHKVGITVHKKIQKGVRYSCSKCHSRLDYIGKVA